MGREIRRVVPNWEHPQEEKYNPFKKVTETRYIPMYNRSYIEAIDDWIDNHQLWKKGKHRAQRGKDGCKKTEYPYYASYDGDAPKLERYRPNWKKKDMTWYQVYETVSEGTPVTPPFATQDELIDYLVANGDFWDQARRVDPRNEGEFRMECDPWSREVAEKFVKGTRYAVSMVISNHVIQRGTDALVNV